MQTTNRYFHKYSHVAVFVGDGDDKVPSVYKQAKTLGGKFTRIVNGLPKDSFVNFSPSVLNNNGNRLIAWRSQPQPFGFRYDRKYFYLNNKPNELYLGHLAADDTILGASKIFRKPHRLSYEDPRLFKGPDNDLYVQFVASAYASKYADEKNPFEAKVLVAHLDPTGAADTTVCPPIGKNRVKGATEKNWCFYPENGLLYCLYSVLPFVIEREKGGTITLDTSILNEVTKGAPTFNSLPPIDIDEGKLIFYHWKAVQTDINGFRWLEYKLGSFVVSNDYKEVLFYDPEPLFTGSKNDHLIVWTNVVGQPISYQPAVILPFGGYLDETTQELVLSLGVNDAFMGVFRTDLRNILLRMKRATSSSLLAPSLPKQHQQLPLQEPVSLAGPQAYSPAPEYNGLRPPIKVRVDLNHPT